MPCDHHADMEALSDTLRKATAAIGDVYFSLPIDGGPPIYRERVYCYELYHQMRVFWPPEYPYVLNGELNKRNHPILSQLGAEYAPDLLIHTPGDMGGNSTIIEVKPAIVRAVGIRHDLEKLDLFVGTVGYQRAIYLIYGNEADDGLVRRVAEAAIDRPAPSPIEIWVHPQAGQPAQYVTTLNV